MAGQPSTAQVVLTSHLSEVAAVIDFYEAASAGRRAVPCLMDWQRDCPAERTVVQRFLKSPDVSDQILLNAMFLSSVAAFEEYLRASLRQALDASAQKAKTYGDLPEGAKVQHVEATGRLLASVKNPPRHLRALDFDDICRRIGTCTDTSAAFELNLEALSLVKSILGIESVFELLRKFGYSTLNWDALGRNAHVKACLGATGNRESANLLQEQVGRMVETRNRIAHTGASSDVTIASLRDHLELLGAVSAALDSALALD